MPGIDCPVTSSQVTIHALHTFSNSTACASIIGFWQGIISVAMLL